MAKPNYQYEKRQKDLAKQRKKQEKEQEKALRKANKVGTATPGDNAEVGEGAAPGKEAVQESQA
jgi:hypothetical protein